jgi:hypothetical protein
MVDPVKGCCRKIKYNGIIVLSALAFTEARGGNTALLHLGIGEDLFNKGSLAALDPIILWVNALQCLI